MPDPYRRLVSTVCLLAYLIASAPGYVMSALSQPYDAECHACADAKTADACSACCGPVRPNSAVQDASAGSQGEQPALPCDSACPDGCFLCNAGGSMPLPFTPVPVLEGLKYLRAVNTGTFISLCQPHPDELIRPPMC